MKALETTDQIELITYPRRIRSTRVRVFGNHGVRYFLEIFKFLKRPEGLRGVKVTLSDPYLRLLSTTQIEVYF